MPLQKLPTSLRLVVIAPDSLVLDTDDEAALALIERSRQMRIGLLEGGFNLIATLPADTFLAERLAQLNPTGSSSTLKVKLGTHLNGLSWPPVMPSDPSCCLRTMTTPATSKKPWPLAFELMSWPVWSRPASALFCIWRWLALNTSKAAALTCRRQRRIARPQNYRPSRQHVDATTGFERSYRSRQTTQSRHGQWLSHGRRSSALVRRRRPS